MDYFIDFETKSDLNLKEVGRARYLAHPSTDIVMLTWATRTTKAQLWLPGMPAPFQLTPRDTVYAFNSEFDRNVNNILGRKHGLYFIHLEQTIDLMAVCARLALPQNLDMASKVLKLENQKLTALGKRLMKKICSPPYTYTREEWLMFVRYGLTDTDALVEMVRVLPTDRLSPSEQRCWLRTQRMNNRGVEIDVRLAARIDQCVEAYKKHRVEFLNVVTEGEIKTAGQVAKIIEWCKEKGVSLPNLQAPTIKATLQNPSLDPQVRRVLEVRQDVASTAVKKFSTVLRLAYRKLLKDFLVYHAASTGRYSSRGFQLHNLIRKSTEDEDELIAMFNDGRIFSLNVVQEAKKLIRSMLKARCDKELIISDFSSIEYVVCLWLAGDLYHLDAFRQGLCPYKMFASKLMHKPYEHITKDERQVAKPGVLGGIYGLSANGHVEYAKSYGITSTYEDSELTIRTFRQEYSLVKQLWYELQDIAMCAIMRPGTPYVYKHITAHVLTDKVGTRWLLLKLPSGRSLFYYDPKISSNTFGRVVVHKGLDSKTRQWATKELSITRLVENVTQATARDLLVYCEEQIDEDVSNVDQLFSCHDETVTECPVSLLQDRKEQIHKIMSTPPEWCADLPLRAETFTSKRYKKG